MNDNKLSFSIAIVGMTYQMIKDCWKRKNW